ncbi:MAG: hypothetical protein ACKPB7_10100, partial [Sphaerospermopsis kisseleviana]
GLPHHQHLFLQQRKVRKSKNIKDINCVKAKILKRRSMQRLYVFTTVIQKIPNYPTATGTL